MARALFVKERHPATPRQLRSSEMSALEGDALSCAAPSARKITRAQPIVPTLAQPIEATHREIATSVLPSRRRPTNKSM